MPTTPGTSLKGKTDSWAAALAGALPFLITGFAAAIMESPPQWSIRNVLVRAGFQVVLGGYLLILVGLATGWVKGFPKWAFPYLGYGLIFALYMMSVATPGLRLFGHTFGRNDLWGWRAWIPFAAMVLICLLLTRSLRPLKQLVRGVWQDWTRLSFMLYGFLPLAVGISFDEVDNAYQFPFMVILPLILAAGAVAYLWSGTRRQQVLSLLGGLVVAGVVAAAGSAVYWNGRQESWMRQPADGLRELLGGLVFWAILAALILAPAILGLLRRLLHALQVGPPRL